MDVRSADSCARAFRHQQPELCIHLAAQASQRLAKSEPIQTDLVNREGCVNIAQAAGNSCRVVYLSSCHVYGPPQRLPISEEHPLDAQGAYAQSKLAGEDVFRKQVKGDWVIVRAFNLLGPDQSTHFAVADWAAQALAGKRVIHTGDLTLKRDYLDVRDAVSGIAVLAEQAESETHVNLCAGKARSLQSLFTLAAPGCEAVTAPERLRLDDPLEIRGCNQKAASLGWAPTVPIEHTIADLVASLSVPS